MDYSLVYLAPKVILKGMNSAKEEGLSYVKLTYIRIWNKYMDRQTVILRM